MESPRIVVSLWGGRASQLGRFPLGWLTTLPRSWVGSSVPLLPSLLHQHSLHWLPRARKAFTLVLRRTLACLAGRAARTVPRRLTECVPVRLSILSVSLAGLEHMALRRHQSRTAVPWPPSVTAVAWWLCVSGTVASSVVLVGAAVELYVSASAGVDGVGCGNATSPCASLQAAIGPYGASGSTPAAVRSSGV